jgi:DHA2 family multidrug resistance protein
MAAGADAATATQRAYIVLHGMIARQASMVTFVTIFRLLGVLFLVMLPLVLLMKRSPGAAVGSAGH